jgi:hypothetical protein
MAIRVCFKVSFIPFFVGFWVTFFRSGYRWFSVKNFRYYYNMWETPRTAPPPPEVLNKKQWCQKNGHEGFNIPNLEGVMIVKTEQVRFFVSCVVCG